MVVAVSRMSLALVGGGRMGQMHLRALAGSRTVRLIDVVEPVAAVRQALAGQGFRVHASLADLVRDARPDGVVIAAPTDQHADVVAEAVASGLAVLCEKPAGVSSSQVAATGERAAAAGVAFQVAYWRRFVPEMVLLRERISAGDLGELLHVACAQWDGAPPPPRFRRSSGGAFVDMGVHEFDLVRWLTGQEVEVVAAAVTPALDPEARPDADNAQVLLSLASGATAAVSLGRHHPPGDLVTVEVFGSRGHRTLTVLDPADGDNAMLAALALQAESFARLVRGGQREGAGTADAVAALRDAESAGEAAR
jgi:myo-inositol 2-dehydrogenase / D-chiro-inositol 1-dehydrogenase